MEIERGRRKIIFVDNDNLSALLTGKAKIVLPEDVEIRVAIGEAHYDTTEFIVSSLSYPKLPTGQMLERLPATIEIIKTEDTA